MTLMMPAAPNPWITRARLNASMELAKTHAMDARVKTASPACDTLR